MKRLLIIFFLLSTLTVHADMGAPSVQAVCKVTMSDGKTYEGFVTLIIGGLHGIHQNGFYLYQDDHYNWTVLFDYEFKKLEKTGETKYKIGNFVPDAKEIYFLAYTWDTKKYWLKESKETITDSTGQYLLTKTQIQRKYKMFDTLPLFTELPKYLHLDYNDKELKRQKIPMNDIVSFEIVMEPAEKWLTEIEQKRKACFAEVYGENSSGDFLEPSWVHELIKDPETLKHWKEYFEKWYRK